MNTAVAAIGFDHARDLMTILAEAEAADSAAEFIELYSPNTEINGYTISLPVGTRYRVTFVAVGATPDRTKQPDPDWRSVRRLKMMELAAC